jgi:amidase
VKRVLALVLSAAAATSALTAQTPASGGRRAVPRAGVAAAPPAARFTVVEATIPEMRAAMEQGRVTSRELVLQYLARIATYDKMLNAVMAVNRHALAEADARDRERAEGRIRGPLHGIPVALKDNIHTTDMPTTGGALAFAGFIPPYEATLTKNLREAGAIILAKTVLTELADALVGGGPPMPGSYSAVGGWAMNPYDPRRDPRELTADGRAVLQPGGSSSGGGTAANFWAVNVGSETGGSILYPSTQNMLVGIKPTVGRISRYGVIPFTADQDSAGPMAKSVTDAAILLGVLESATPDPNDPASKACTPPPGRDYTAFLKRDGLTGARIGIPRASFYTPAKVPGRDRTAGGLNTDQAAVMESAIAALKAAGAIVVDPADIPSILEQDSSKNYLAWGRCAGMDTSKGRDANCSVVFKYGLKRDFNAWLATLGPTAPVKSLTEMRMFNLTHTRGNAIRYGQSNLDAADEMDVVADKARYEADRAKDLALAATHGIDAVMKANRLDALLFPGWTGANIADKPGYPTVIVPFGMVPNVLTPPLPDAFNAKPMPYGISFSGMACSEPRLIELAYSFEQATKKRIPPSSTP